MSDGARRLWQRLGADRAFYYRFFNRRKLTLSADLDSALEALGSARYDPERRVGTLLASPTTVHGDGESWRPGKLAVIFAAERREQAFEMEREFRARHEG